MHAAVWGMEYFSHHLKGHCIQEAMLQYDFEIHYQKGAEMLADYLSRNIASIHDLISDEVVETAEQGDPCLQAILAYIKYGTIPPDKDLKQLITRYGFKCFIDKDLLWIQLFDEHLGHRSFIMVPDSLRYCLISQFHNSWFGGHEGVHKMVQWMQLYYFWPNMLNNVNEVIKSCERCQKSATTPAIPPSSMQPLPTLTAPNQRFHADLFGPLKISASGKKYILLMTDAFTRYIELVAIENKEADCVMDAIFTHWICRYGIPPQMVTNQDKEFVAKISSKSGRN
jgi:hypothetical protein